MKRAPLFITILIIVLSVSGYFVYEKYFIKKIVSPWDLVPKGAVAVYEASACDECVEPVKASSLWEIINKASFFDKQQDSVQKFLAKAITQKSGSLTSLHITKKDAFDFVYYFPLNDVSGRKLFEATTEDWKTRDGFRYREREYNGHQINELSTSGSTFSWVTLKDVWVGSFTPFLVEDVIRVFGDGGESIFKKDIADVYQMPRLKNDAGNLYVHLENLSEWLSVFASGTNLDMIKYFGKAALLDIKSVNDNLVLNGFSVEDPQQASVLSVFNEQSPTSFSLKQFVSNRTVMLLSYGISNGSDFGEKLNAFSQRDQKVVDTLKQLTSSLKIDLSNLYQSIKNEVGVCYVESSDQQMSKVLLIESDDTNKWIEPFNAISDRLSVDTVFYERYSGYEIRELPVFRFPEKILSPFVSGFDHSYYTVAGQTILIAENLEELKFFLEDIDREDTWGKSVSQNQFLESTLLESNVSLYVNTPRIWNILRSSLNEKWGRFVQENRGLFSSIGMGAIQFSHLNQSFYTNVSWMYRQPQMAESERREQTQNIVTKFQVGLQGESFVVKSHVDKTNELFLQDSSYNIHLVSSKGSVLWSKPMNSAIIGDVFQVDYFKNGKLQYLFTTDGALHIIDRLGNYVQPFPIKLAIKDIQFLDLIDYDHSKNYRFLIADKSGKLWMYDKEGNNLDGWNPRNVEGMLHCAPRHHRVRGKDYLTAIRNDGKVYVTNRRGESIKGFPMNLDARPSGDYFLEIGSSLSQTNFVIVSRDGFRIKFNLDGKIQSRETLLKSSVDARFSLVKEMNGKSYCIVRQEPRNLTVSDQSGKQIIVNEYIGMNTINVQYYDFGAGKIFYLITDVVQNLTYAYDRQGNLLTSPPMEADFSRLAIDNADNLRIYLTYQNALRVKSLF